MATTSSNPIPSFSQIVSDAQEKAQGLYDLVSEASAAMVEAASSQQNFIPGTSETPLSLRVKGIAEMESQRKAAAVAKAANWEELSITLGQDLAQLAQKQRGLTASIAADKAVSLWEDPGQAIINAFTLPWDMQELEGLNTQIASTKASMDAINTHVQQSAKTADAIKQSITEDTLAEQTAAVANLMASKHNAAKIQAYKEQGAALKDILSMGEKQVHLYMQQQQLADQAEAREMRKKQYDRQMEVLDLQLRKEQKGERAEAIHLEMVNRALAVEGKQQLTPEQFTTYKQTSGKLIDTLARKGLELTVGGRDNYSHGDTIPEIFEYENAIGWRPDPNKPQQMTVKVWQNQALNAAAESTKNKSLVPVNAEQSFARKWKDEQDNIQGTSPFRLPSAIVYAENSSFMKHPIWQKYINPTLNEGNAKQPLSEDTLLEAAKQAILNREVKSGEAARFVTSIVNQGIAINNTALEFEKIAGKRQTKYGYRVGVGIFPGKEAVNLSDPVEVEAALQGMVIRQFGLSGHLRIDKGG